MLRQLLWLAAPLFFSNGRVETLRGMDSETEVAVKDDERPPGLANALQGFKLKKTVPVEAKDPTPRPPELVEGAEFIAEGEQIGRVSQAFDEWGAEVLLVDFFAYSCTNCIRTIPWMRLIYDTFRPKGLRVLAFARPEFDFEGDLSNVKAWMSRNSIRYPVATDVNGTNWRAWGVLGWPMHFLVRRDRRSASAGKLVLEYTHLGDQHHDVLWNMIINLLGVRDVPTVGPERGMDVFTDVELFFGKAHRIKNSGLGDCAKGNACEVVDRSDLDSLAVTLPMPLADRYVVYGAGWCHFCRKAKLGLEMVGATFDYIDVDLYGGPDAVLKALQSMDLVPIVHKTLPIIFDTTSSFIGGYSDLLRAIPGIEDSLVSARADASSLVYYRDSSKVRVSWLGEQAWGVDAEALTALVAGASLTFQAELRNATRGFAMYAVCNPVDVKAGGWLEVLRHCSDCVATKVDIPYPGRHYLGSSNAALTKVELRASLGMRVYVLWLTTEPHNSSSVS